MPFVSDTSFSLLYDAHHRRHTEDLAFWQKLATRYGDPILELGCGTGRVLLELAQSGHQMTGLDFDPAMLAILRQYLTPEIKPRVALLLSDMRNFHLACAFSLVVLPCNTYSGFCAQERESILQCVRCCLRSGGAFVASLPNPRLLRHLPIRAVAEIEEIFPHPRDGEPVQVSSAWHRQATCITFTWHYDHLLPDGGVERLTTQVSHQLTSSEDYICELRAAGFSSIDSFGDFDSTPYTADAPYLILLAA